MLVWNLGEKDIIVVDEDFWIIVVFEVFRLDEIILEVSVGRE